MKKGRKIMTKRFGFTLAEVLITLGIIGVVAAMTIPTLMNQTSGAEFKAGFKKAVSVLNQAVTMNVALDGSDFGALVTSGTVAGSVYAMYNARMNVIKTVDGADASMGANFGANNYVLYFNDGMAVSFPTNSTNCTSSGQANCTMVVDVNGVRKPNRASQKTSSADTRGIYDQFALNFYNQQIEARNQAAKYILYN